MVSLTTWTIIKKPEKFVKIPLPCPTNKLSFKT